MRKRWKLTVSILVWVKCHTIILFCKKMHPIAHCHGWKQQPQIIYFFLFNSFSSLLKSLRFLFAPEWKSALSSIENQLSFGSFLNGGRNSTLYMSWYFIFLETFPWQTSLLLRVFFPSPLENLTNIFFYFCCRFLAFYIRFKYANLFVVH